MIGAEATSRCFPKSQRLEPPPTAPRMQPSTPPRPGTDGGRVHLIRRQGLRGAMLSTNLAKQTRRFTRMRDAGRLLCSLHINNTTMCVKRLRSSTMIDEYLRHASMPVMLTRAWSASSNTDDQHSAHFDLKLKPQALGELTGNSWVPPSR